MRIQAIDRVSNLSFGFIAIFTVNEPVGKKGSANKDPISSEFVAASTKREAQSSNCTP